MRIQRCDQNAAILSIIMRASLLEWLPLQAHGSFKNNMFCVLTDRIFVAICGGKVSFVLWDIPDQSECQADGGLLNLNIDEIQTVPRRLLSIFLENLGFEIQQCKTKSQLWRAIPALNSRIIVDWKMFCIRVGEASHSESICYGFPIQSHHHRTLSRWFAKKAKSFCMIDER